MCEAESPRKNGEMCEGESPRKKQKYSEGYIRGIVERVRNGEKIADVSRSEVPSIPQSTIRTWVQKERGKSKSNTVPNTGPVHQDQSVVPDNRNKNKYSRDEVGHDSLPGDWSGWIVIMSSNNKGDFWVKRNGKNCGFAYQNLEKWMKNIFGIFEMAIINPKSKDQSVVFMACGEILTTIGKYCCDDSSDQTDRINDVLSKGYEVLVRWSYANPGTERQAKQEESLILSRYLYTWRKRRVKREKVKDEQVRGNWTDWELIMSPVQKEGFIGRDGCNKGFRRDNMETLFRDNFGILELQITKGDSKVVKYLRNGRILTLLLRYCNDGYRKSDVLNQVLSEDYSVSVRYYYFNTDTGKENAAASLRQLLSRYDYAWNKTLREYIDDEDIPGNWLDWVTVLTPHSRPGWKLRNNKDTGKGYRRENLTNSFEEKYGTFEMKVGCSCDTDLEETRSKNDDTDVVSYIGKGNILTEVRTQCFDETKQSPLIDQALKEGKDISIRYCYTKNDTLEEAEDLERLLLHRYDYAWIRSKREDVYDNDLPGEWSEWSKVMKPGVVEKGWAWRDERFVGFKVKTLDGLYKDEYSIFEMAIEEPDQDVVVHVGKGKILSELEKYCRINTDGSYKFLPISDALSRRCNILVRYRDAQSEEDAEHIENQLLTRYDYSWNWTKREDVDHSCLQGKNWSDWQPLMAPNRNGPEWIRRDPGHTGWRLTDEGLKIIVEDRSGIYEWRVRKDRRAIVVYTGKSENLLQRLTDYCKNGSHKSEDWDKDNLEYFNKALHYGYTICARFRYTDQMSDEENKLLDRYDYAWNKSRNGMQRNIFLSDNIELRR